MRKLALIILDGWGLGEQKKNNAIYMARTPFFDSIWQKYPSTQLQASAQFVGLPENQIGGSEVGHLTIGAGRILYQELPRINRAMMQMEAEFGILQIDNFMKMVQIAREKPVHLIGLLSPGGVHSHEEHLFRLLEILKLHNCKEPYIHVISDGRDTPPTSGKKSAEKLINKVREMKYGKIVTLIGRFYGMDRDNNQDRTQKAVDLIVKGNGTKDTKGTDEFSKLLNAFDASYEQKTTDEFIEPVILDDTYHGIQPGEPVFFFNFRNDRMKQLVSAIAKARPENEVFTMTRYDKQFPYNVVFEKQTISNTVAEILSRNNLKQLKAAETEKFAHVTYFFNGGVEVTFNGELRSLAPSNKVRHDQIPEMQASKIAQNIKVIVEKDSPDFVLVNFANPDMVGHTGNFKAVVEGVESVDRELKSLTAFLTKHGYICCITADHGNADYMYDLVTGEPHTAHTLAPVPFIVYDPLDINNQHLHLDTNPENGLSKIAGTVLNLMGLQKKHEFESLITK